MCLYPRLIHNKKYTKTKKNGGNIPPVHDTRVLHVPIPCNNCIECRKKKAREWQIRLQEDIKTNEGAKFVTLTFSDQSISKIFSELMYGRPDLWNIKPYERDNLIAKRAMRLFNERYRKKYKKALRHWTVTELGHNGTNNIHLHGIVWPKCTLDELEAIWQYGWVWKYKMVKGIKTNYVNNKTINYCTKYVMKRDLKYKHYKSIILCSPGIGKNYTNTYNATRNKYNGTETRQTYKTDTGHKIALPSYWRKKIYTDDEREQLWINSIEENNTWICGEKVLTSNTDELHRLRDYYRKLNTRLGYGGYKQDEERLKWEQQTRQDMFIQRIKNAEK